ncbi:MAG: hypothetical protein GKR89_10880 [Candidatus Latescibacteria bacterium]|nr:hypothetical protein [Candidatus Latescibacterota bacterium]
MPSLHEPVALIPLERELQERLVWFVRLRWLAGCAIIGGAWLAQNLVPVDFSPWPLYWTGLAVLAYNILFDQHLRRPFWRRSYRATVYAQMAFDWLALIFLVHYTGGIQSPLMLAFAFHLIIGAILLPRSVCYVQAVLVAFLSGGLALLETSGWWPPVSLEGLYTAPPRTPLDQLFRWLSLSAFLAVTALLATSITAPVRRKEAELLRSEQELDQAYGEIQALSDERSWFARTTHHQLRAPLAAIGSALDALAYAGPLAAKQGELIGRARRRVDEGLDTIRDLLDLAAAQRSGASLEAEAVDLRVCLQKAAVVADERAVLEGVELDVDLAPVLAVWADAGDMRRIFDNLLDNAVKYSPAGGRVELTATRAGGQARIAVSDTGIGIDPADQEAIFRGFYRTAAAKASGAVGSGLGLSIARQLAQRWGGGLEVQSAPNQGSCFTVVLPLYNKE